MEQLAALEVIALSQAAQAFSGIMDGRDKYELERRVRELTGLPDRGQPRHSGPPPTRPLPD